jgi:acetyl esterase/lipase/predicted NBD/HSP70 family sugar kinase
VTGGPVLALDLGGTHVSAGRVDVGRKTVVDSVRLTLPPDAGRDELVELILRAAADVAGDAGVVGFASPGPFDYARGVAWLEHKLQALHGVDLRARLSARLGVPPELITFVNDADAFLVGESWAGAAEGQRRVVGITLGTGVGSAFLADGTIVDSGPRVPPGGEIHRLTHRGASLEDSVSRAALIARYDEGIDVDEVAARARAGDERAREAFDHVARELGEALAPWLQSFEATCLVVGGSIAAAWDLLEPGLRQALACSQRLETLLRARLLHDAALLGAARCASAAADQRHNPHTSGGHRAAGVRPLHELTVAEARAAQEAEAPVSLGEYEIETLALDGPVEIRLHRPPASRPIPLCVWLPGGGWVLDTMAVSDPACRRLAAETPCAVAMVRYRLAPEHRFPTQLDDSAAAVRWLVGRADALDLDPSRVAIGGTSAGANLAAAVSLVVRDEQEVVLVTQVLVYPVLVYDPGAPSPVDPGGDGFTRRDADWCWSHYLARPEDGSNALASPLLAEDLAGLPSALLIAAGLDPLRDEAVRYAARLEHAGVPVQLACFDGAPHGFFSLASDAADRAHRLVIDILRRAFSVASAA